MLKAVIFDIGGVVLRSPFIAIDKYERQHRLPSNYLNCSIVERGHQGAWQKFERGELDLFTFYRLFGQDLSDTDNGNTWYKKYCVKRGIECPTLPEHLNVDGRQLFHLMMQEAQVYDPHICRAIIHLKASKRYKVIALTNNFSKTPGNSPIPQSEIEALGWQEGVVPSQLRELFHDFCDSSELGTRKPEPEFYMLACRRNGITPHEAVFLDDIKMNLKAARELGMGTIHVPIGKTLEAVKELEVKLGLDLTSEITVATRSNL